MDHQITPSTLQRYLVTQHRWANQRALAEVRDATTSPEALASLAEHPNDVIRAYVAIHPHTPANTIRTLLHDPDAFVRHAVLIHPSLTNDLLVELLAQAHLGRIQAIASNPNCSPTLLSELATHPSLTIQQAVARHPSTPKTTLRTLVRRGDRSIWAQAAITDALLHNPSTPMSVRQRATRFLERYPDVLALIDTRT